MTSLKTILVHIDGTGAATRRLGIALDLARRHGASLDVAFAVAPRFVPLPIPLADGMPAAPLLEEVDDRHRRHARAVYQRLCGDSANVRWLDCSGPGMVDHLLRQARLTDCVVLGQADREDASGSDVPPHLVEAMLSGAGVPALLIPRVGAAEALGDVALVAWKSTPESARAMASALPLLEQARDVHVAVSAADARDAMGIQHFLSVHGVRQVHVHAGVAEAGAGDALLSLAADTGAGLLVMGGYGHSRAREWILGGATRTVLTAMTVPVWMAH